MMTQWRVKEVSDLTNVSVRMLHHYDKIGLLKPAGRSDNSYRWYSEQDLAKLQQIIALKFFGFSLKQIKDMLQQERGIQEHLFVQQQMLKEQTEHLKYTQKALSTVLQRYKTSKSLDWNDLITLIERYRMAEEIKKTWVGKLNKDQQERYIAFKQAYPKEVGAWEKTIELINSKQFGNPEGPDGERVIKIFNKYSQVQVMWAKTKKSKKMTKSDATELLETIKKFKAEGMPLNPEGNLWFAKAIVAYRLRCWEQLHKDITKNLDADPESAAGKKLAEQWRELIADSCAGGSKDFTFGMTLLMNAAREKLEMQDKTEITPKPEIAQYAKMAVDPMALSWIEKALRLH